MATSGYATEELQPSQTQGGSVTTSSSAQQKATCTTTPQFPADIQSSPASAPSHSASIARLQTTPTSQKKAVLATPPPGATPIAQYVTGELQSSASQSGNGQRTPQFIVVTVTEGSLHSSDSVSDSNSPPAGQTGVPTQVVQQVQTAQRSGVQATSKSQRGPLGDSNLHITTDVPVQHVYSSQFGEGDANYSSTPIRSNSFPYADSSLYPQTTPSVTYYETSPTAGSQVTSPATTQVVSVTSGAVTGVASMFSEGSSGITVAAGGSSSGMGGAGGVVTPGGVGSYVIPCGYMLGGGNQSFSQNTRASPATVQWLMDNYETAEGVSLPRSTLYCHYLLHCQQTKLEPVNAASFGKLIRSVFMGLRTRRLGTRGNSKYHYYGLRIKSSSPLLRLLEDQQHLALRQQPYSQKQRIKSIHKVEGLTNGMALGAGQQQGSGSSDISGQVHQYQQFLDASRGLPEFSELKVLDKCLPDGLLPQHIHNYQLLYREHCEAIQDVMVNLQFPLVETLWKSFWRFSEGQSNSADSLDLHDESEKRLPKSVLVLLCKYEPVLSWTRDCDNILYQSLVEILIPDVLRPIPSALTQAIRNFAKSLENWLTNALINIPEEMVSYKVVCAGAFAQTLRRYTSLNHLAQAARAVLQNTAQITQMLSDLNRVDFTNVQEQASWVCGCDDGVVQRMEQDFKMTLQEQNSLEQWAAWLDGVVSQVLKPYTGSSAFPKVAKLFLLKWSFYSSMVIRDLTLRSAASFGSFHLIRLLYDEYMYYLIEHRVAQAKGETPIAVMGEFASLNRGQRSTDPDKDEEDEEEDDETDEDQDLSAHAHSIVMGDESLEPPAKLARADLFNSSTQN
ncbi:MHC class II regulatory factor RFX1 [Triplophysa rosa]|uniref:MHC class II regulatory factor RFX1 n=1 Tax=Triplophysa rosa TaxID=992332 RepID=UPI002545D006|nr:MHC class II regulatory factor RFX1 [Triplophysa rosa]